MAQGTGRPSAGRGKKPIASRTTKNTGETRNTKDKQEKVSQRGTRGSSRSKDFNSAEKPGKDFAKSETGYKKYPKPYEKKKEYGNDRGKPFRPKYRKDIGGEFRPKKDDGLIRLNRYLSNAGIASRRDADKLIELGLVSVNGKVVTEMGLRVDPRKDVVKYDDKNLKPEKLRYVLLNKPKDYITTMDDPEERKTVMHLVREACKERIYPVGRLDRQTTGLLLFTNDGDLAKRLTHPKHGYQKLYHVETLEKVKGEHLDAIREGVQLEDGFIKADEISLVNGDPRQVGIRIHSGKNRIVRRIFENFNYTVKKLDRVMFAGLTKKDLARGRYRHLTEQEVSFLKMIR